MMVKRGKLEIMRDILQIVQEQKNIKVTPLLRKSNLFSARFKEYYDELTLRQLVKEEFHNQDKYITLTDKGFRFLEKYKAIIDFIDEFEL